MLCRSWLPSACLLLSACSTPRPLQPIEPRYPDMLRSANVAGDISVNVTIDRDGRVAAVRYDSTSNGHELFRMSARTYLQHLRFSPARWFGLAHVGSASYEIQFVLVRAPEDPLRPNDRHAANDTITACPRSRDPRRIIVCAPSTLSRTEVSH